MSARDRHRCGVLALCLLGVVFRLPLAGQALDSTPRITRGTCPAAHCNLGLWQSGTALPVFATPAAVRPAFSLKPGAPFEALSGETHAVPGVHVLRDRLDVFDEKTTASLAPGDTIRTLAYLGDNRFSVEAGRRPWTAVLDERDSARLQTLRPRREAWWVKVKAADGRVGWIDGATPGIAGATLLDMLPPLSPSTLDSVLLAGLAGPVAEIVQDRSSSAGPAFEAAIDGAREGEGVVWWRAGALQLLQLRYRTLLTATGTTRPELSGLSARTVVCCGDLTFQRLVTFTRRLPDYVATITIPDQGERHVVEAFYQDGRMVRLIRDSQPVSIAYEDSVIGRAWYSDARALVQALPANAAVPPGSPPRTAAPAPPAKESWLSGMRLVGLSVGAFVLVLAGVAGWWLWRRKRKAPARRSAPAAAEPTVTPPPPEEEEGWVCPYCHADVLLDLDTCWLCGRPRPAEPPPPAPQSICGCGEPAPAGATSCKRCGKRFKPGGF